MLRRKGEINVILPFKRNEFQKVSVAITPVAYWERRFKRVLSRATRVIIASDQRLSGNDLIYQYANLLQNGLAILRAQSLDTEVIPLAQTWPCKFGY